MEASATERRLLLRREHLTRDRPWRVAPQLSVFLLRGARQGRRALGSPPDERIRAMKGSQKVIALLNDVLTNELTAINQYFLHARMCENWGYERLWHKVRAESIDEMKHADVIIERILYLEGLPNLQKLGTISVGQTVDEQLRLDLALESTAIPVLNRGIELSRAEADNGTADLLEDILEDEEDHAHWLEAQLALIQQAGLQNYLAEQLKKDD
jgi:bacterioferritin